MLFLRLRLVDFAGQQDLAVVALEHLALGLPLVQDIGGGLVVACLLLHGLQPLRELRDLLCSPIETLPP